MSLLKNQSTLPVLALAGPTAVGKSEVALLLAQQLPGEIISVDSMQVYRGLDIGTAKPSLAERQTVPHHLIDTVEITDSFDAAQFAQHARQLIPEIQARGRVPILCGGTGLYFKALLAGLGPAPPSQPALRAQLELVPLPRLLDELALRDPQTFERIDRQNPRRVIRALEVVRLTGKPFADQRADWQLPPSERLVPQSCCFGLSRTPADLQARIERRVDKMFQLGLIEETRRLLDLGLAQNRTALQAIGYRQVTDYLAGGRSLADTVTLVKQATRQLAKRQMSWFRRQMAMTWLSVTHEASAERTLEKLRAALPG